MMDFEFINTEKFHIKAWIKVALNVLQVHKNDSNEELQKKIKYLIACSE